MNNDNPEFHTQEPNKLPILFRDDILAEWHTANSSLLHMKIHKFCEYRKGVANTALSIEWTPRSFLKPLKHKSILFHLLSFFIYLVSMPPAMGA